MYRKILILMLDKKLLEDINANKLTRAETAELAARMERSRSEIRPLLDTSIESQ